MGSVTKQHTHHLVPLLGTIAPYLHLYTGAVMQDLAVEQYSTWEDQCSSTHIGDTVVIMEIPPRCSLRQPTSSLYSK